MTTDTLTRPRAMTSTRPPFRADHVGSLLRPAALKDARAKVAAGELSPEGLKEVEDRAIKDVIARQEAVGLRAVTDGEFRRSAWQWDFLERLDGVEVGLGEAAPFAGAPARSKVVRVVRKLGFSHHPMLDHFAFLKANAKATPKMTLPSPTMLVSAMRDWRDIVKFYPSLDEFYADLGAAFRKAVGDFAAAGCTYLQLDDCNLSYLCDPSAREKVKARGDDPDALLEAWVTLINTALSGRGEGMTISTHICRGNFRSSWLASGGYEPIAETLFNRIKFDAYFLEYDTDRAGGFEPLRFLPKNADTRVVLGLITTKTGEMEDRDTLLRRIEAAAKYVDIERLCLSPQCGFASTEEGNVIAEDDQWAKLALAVEVAQEVWGGV
jgi:5-methyltetrahydropteroyltriglutamate--homocysteine methyltransferase